MFEFKQSLWVNASLDDVFGFFSDASNLEKITPDYLNFNIITPKPIDIKKGCIIDYRLKLRFIPIYWKSEITEWDPPYRFADEQLKGPYRSWRHVHTFNEHDGGTMMHDHVQYDVPGGPLKGIINALFVKKDVASIFQHRKSVISEIFKSE